MRLNVAYSSDENYVRHLATSIISLLENNKVFDEIFIYVIEKGISNNSKAILQEIANKYRRDLILIPLEDSVERIDVDNTISIMAYGRLFLGSLLNCDKVIYMDCDSIVLGSFCDLWQIDINNSYFAAVQDTVNEYYLSDIGLNKQDRYINSGFLYINLDKWRKDNLEEKFIQFIKDFKGSVPHHDQGVLNAVCRNKIRLISPIYNLQCPMFHFSVKQLKQIYKIEHYYSESDIENARKEPVFVHYTNGFFNRPWNENCTHPMLKEYIKYLDLSPWKGMILKGELHKNAKIMKFIYEKFPFVIYRNISNLTVMRKKIKYKKQKNELDIRHGG